MTCVQRKTQEFNRKEIHQEIANKHKNVPRSFKPTNCCDWESARGNAYSSFAVLQMRESKIRNSSESGNVRADVSFKGRHHLSQSSCNYEMSTWGKKKDRWNEAVVLKVILKKKPQTNYFWSEATCLCYLPAQPTVTALGISGNLIIIIKQVYPVWVLLCWIFFVFVCKSPWHPEVKCKRVDNN